MFASTKYTKHSLLKPPLAIFTLSVALGFALGVYSDARPVSRAAHLYAGQTTYDGNLTLLTTSYVNGGVGLFLRNNNPSPVFVDEYSVDRGDVFECSGRHVQILGYAVRPICTVRPSALAPPTFASPSPSSSPTYLTLSPMVPTEGQPTLRMSVIWHLGPRRTPEPASPTPSPSPSPSPTPKP